jgi:hypothetical protein
VLFVPPLSRLSGGLANLYQTARDLRELGHTVALVCPDSKTAAFGEMEEAGFTVLPWKDLALSPSDLWLVPESWPNALGPGIRQGAAAVVYAQSWNFLLTTLPAGVRWRQLPVRFIAVSHPVAWFMTEILELKVEGLLPPALHPAFFAARETRPESPIRIAWMPRKNKALAEQIRLVAEAALLRHPDSPAVEWVAISRLPPHEVAACFASCHIYLNTAFPEGFGLPALEAMAVGCTPVGFTGFGGWEYMRQSPSVPYAPALPPRETPWEGNGFFFADGDIMAAGIGLARAARLAAAGDREWRRMIRMGKTAARAYTREARMPALAKLWAGLTAGL